MKTRLLTVMVLASASVLNGQWIQTNGPFGGGPVLSIAVSGSIVFVGTNEGVFRSTDEGVSWYPTNGGLTLPYSSRIPAINSIISTDSGVFAAGDHEYVFRSVDGGGTWTRTNVRIVRAPSLASTRTAVFIGSYTGVFRSENWGASWTQVNSGLADTLVRAILAVNDTTLLAGTSTGVFRTTNRGISWSRSIGGPSSVRALAVVGTRVFAGGGTSVYVSTDRGVNWALASAGLPAQLTGNGVTVLCGAGGYVFAGTQYDGVFRSDAASVQWWRASTGLNPLVDAVAAKGNSVLAGTGGGFFKTTNAGASWSAFNQGLAITDVQWLWCEFSRLYASSVDGLYFSSNAGSSWSPVLFNGSPIPYVKSLLTRGNRLFAGTWPEGIITSLDSGATWALANAGLPYPASVSGIVAVAETLVTSTVGGVYVSTNNGANWLVTNTQLDYISALAGDGHRLFGCVSGSDYPPTTYLYYSSDRGSTWSRRGLVVSGSSANTLIIVNNVLLAGTNNGTFRSTDEGASWTNADDGLPPGLQSIYSFACRDSAIFLANGSGVYRSTDGGLKWKPVNSGLTDLGTTSLATDSINLYAGTGSGVWRCSLADMITSTRGREGDLTKSYMLLQNYPNPFNPGTTITYELPKSSEVRLSVYDMLGREVSVLVNERRDAGVHEVKYDASDLSSGMYFYRLQAGDFIQTRKLLVLK